MRSALVVGTGLVGTSVALALATRGVTVHLADIDTSAARTAASLGAGTIDAPTAPVDLLIVAVPPARVGAIIAEHQRRGAARAYTDVASVKTRPVVEVAEHGGTRETYVGGHPLAGRERSGPLAARADLFEGRPWVLTPTAETSPATLASVRELVDLCDAVPVVMEPADHDHAVALVSHAPHLVAALMAGRLRDAPESATRIAGQGVRDVTRIAASDPALWEDILASNAAAVADVLDAYAGDLTSAVAALRAVATGETGAAKQATEDLVDLLRRGNAGHARIPGKHGAPPAIYASVQVMLSDAPGELARLFAAVGALEVNIEDVAIEHVAGQPLGLVTLSVAPEVADHLVTELTATGWVAGR
jgi:prephenate dehydrogenase